MDGSKIVVCFKQHNQIVVWNVQSTQRLIQIDFSVLDRTQDMPSSGQANAALQMVQKVTFDKICSNFLLISGEKAHLVKITPSSDGTVVRKHLSQCQKRPFIDEAVEKAKNEENNNQQQATAQQQTSSGAAGAGQGKRRSLQKLFAGELVVNLFDTGSAMKRYYLVVSNTQKVFYLLEPQGDKLVVRGEQSFPAQPAQNVTQVTANDNYTKLLVNSDRFLRLYQVFYPNGPTERARFELLDTFQDVINHNRWLNCQFLRLNENTKILSQHPVSESFMGSASLLTPQ